MSIRPSEVVWEGDSLATLKGFPDSPRANLGHYLRLLQMGEDPPDSSPVPGLAGVHELRDEDERAWYRVLCTKRINQRIYVLHCFEKKTNKITKRDLNTAKLRLKRVKVRLMEEERNAKKERRNPARKPGKRVG